MTNAPASLVPGVALTTGAAPLYTAPAATTVVAKKAIVSNTSASTASVSVSVTRGSQGSFLVSSSPIGAGQTYVIPELSNLVLRPGDGLSASASAAGALSMIVSGYTVT